MRYQSDELTIDSLPEEGKLVVRWLGRSDGTDPSGTFRPLLEALSADVSKAQSVEFDFRSLEYMNSSSIRPILKLVQGASGSASSVRVVYDKNKTWQRLSFMAIGTALAGLNNVEVCA
ncbi:MAG TPA: hypothetical protein VFS67_04465 [Polyangiaceae bacterium]|jgi:hypothetical protein|nr:hypothetical protein [Polyangiaceae bacterium]